MRAIAQRPINEREEDNLNPAKREPARMFQRTRSRRRKEAYLTVAADTPLPCAGGYSLSGFQSARNIRARRAAAHC